MLTYWICVRNGQIAFRKRVENQNKLEVVVLSRFSVKRPYIIVVAVIVILILGGVSLSKIKTDLLPQMDLPYLAVITTDPGASAEKVEEEVTSVLEGALGTVNGVSGTTSTSANNFSLIFLQFEDGTDMDSALVKVSSAVNQVQTKLPDTAGTPNFMEISADMMATMYIVAQYDDKDIYGLSAFVDEEVVPALERKNGVADVSTVGAVAKSIEVRLNDSKIEDVNNRVLSNVNSKLADAKKALDEGDKAIAAAEEELAKQTEELANTQQTTADQVGQGSSGLTTLIAVESSKLSTLGAQLQAMYTSNPSLVVSPTEEVLKLQKDIADSQKNLEDYQSQLAAVESGSVTAASGFGSGTAQLAAAQATLAQQKEDLKEARKQYEESREAAIEQANINALVDKNTLSQLIMAQNFSMPAGYLDSDTDDQWLLRVGTNIESEADLENLLLLNMDGVGEVRLKDVADITVVDNVGNAYMKVNGEEGVMLSVFKGSTANTSEVSANCQEAIEELQEKFPGLHLNIVSDQGSYISLYIDTILQSLLLGALLAIVVLAVFLRDWKPTVIVAFSIPFSVLCALLLMYFTGIELNVMSLGGLALAIGMLVDNSIIVLENIYRLRGRGIPAARAAVQGAKQISGAVIASTLTTICVFVPIIFTDGLVNQLMLPFALTIAYVLTASLVIALTLVPSVSAFVFKNYVPKQYDGFERLKDKYERSLRWCLNHKALPLGLAGVLLVVAIVGVVNTGVTLVPTMTSKTVSVNAIMPEDIEKKDAFATADKIMEEALALEGVAFVGGMDGTSTISMIADTQSSSPSEGGAYGMFTFYIQTDDTITTETQVLDLVAQLEENTKDLNCTLLSEASSSDAMSSMLGSGLSISLRGPDQDGLIAMSEDIMAIIDEVEGYTEIENGLEEAATEVNLIIDKDLLTEKGYTVAQLYTDLAGMLTTETQSTTLTVDDYSMVVNIIDETNPVTIGNLLSTEIEITTQAGEKNTIKLGDVAKIEEDVAANSITHVGTQRAMSVSAEVEEGYNNALLARDLQTKLADYEVPDGYSYTFSGEISNIDTMLEQMLLMLLLGFVLIYLVMVAQFQSLLSPFIIIFTVPLAFTGGFFGLVATGEPLSMLSLMGFAVLMGTVVNNGIVFVDYVNQLRRGGLEKRDALAASGRTRMRPILMTALTTILAMVPMIVSDGIGASMQSGMAAVVVGGLLYATFMTLYIVPIMYDLFYRRVPYEIDLGPDNIDDDPGDAQAYLEALRGAHAAPVMAAAGAAAGAATGAATAPLSAEEAEDREMAMPKKRRWFGKKNE